MTRHVIIIGGGIMGQCSAYYMLRAGHRVTIISDDLDSGCSFRNAGMIVPSHFIPLASPGALRKGLTWMLDSKSPFYLRPRMNLDLLRWLLIFIRNSNARNVKRSASILMNLNLRSRELYLTMAEEMSNDLEVHTKGLMMLFRSEEAQKEEFLAADKAVSIGLKPMKLDAAGVAEVDPGTPYDVMGGVFYPADAFLNPERLMKELKNHNLALGCKMIEKSINRLNGQAGVISTVNLGNEIVSGDEYVLAAGAFSQDLVRNLGIHLPLQGGKGYSVTVVKPHTMPTVCSILTESKVAITPMNGNLRIAGTLEIAGLNTEIDKGRVRSFLRQTGEYLPAFEGLDIDDFDIWTGLRPCSPDGLPYVGRSRKFRNLIFATGHAMMGLSLGAVTGRIVNDLISGREPEFDLTLMNPERF